MFDGIFGCADNGLNDTSDLASDDMDKVIREWEARDIPTPQTPPLPSNEQQAAIQSAPSPHERQAAFLAGGAAAGVPQQFAESGSLPPASRHVRSRSPRNCKVAAAAKAAKSVGIPVDTYLDLHSSYASWQPQLAAHFRTLREQQIRRCYLQRAMVHEAVGVGMGSDNAVWQDTLFCARAFVFSSMFPKQCLQTWVAYILSKLVMFPGILSLPSPKPPLPSQVITSQGQVSTAQDTCPMAYALPQPLKS